MNCLQNMNERRFWFSASKLHLRTTIYNSLLGTDCLVMANWGHILFFSGLKKWRGIGGDLAVLRKAENSTESLFFACSTINTHLDMIQKRILMFDKIHIHKSKWSARLPTEQPGIQAREGELGRQEQLVHKMGGLGSDVPRSIRTMFIFLCTNAARERLIR